MYWTWAEKRGRKSCACSSNPSSTDATRIVTLVHGTFSPHASWVQPDSALSKAVSEVPGTVVTRLCWSGANSHVARLKAADRLCEHVEKWAASHPDAEHVVVGHSHGGNVGAMALQRFESDPSNAALVSLSTPFLAISERRSSMLGGQIAALFAAFIAFTAIGGVLLARSAHSTLAWVSCLTGVIGAWFWAISLLESWWPLHRYSRDVHAGATPLSLLAQEPLAPRIRVSCLTARRDEARFALNAGQTTSDLLTWVVRMLSLSASLLWLAIAGFLFAGVRGGLSQADLSNLAVAAILLGVLVPVLLLGVSMALSVTTGVFGNGSFYLSWFARQRPVQTPPGAASLIQLERTSNRGLAHSASYADPAGVEVVRKAVAGQPIPDANLIDSAARSHEAAGGHLSGRAAAIWLIGLTLLSVASIGTVRVQDPGPRLAEQFLPATEVAPRQRAESRVNGFVLAPRTARADRPSEPTGWIWHHHSEGPLWISLPTSFELTTESGDRFTPDMRFDNDDGHVSLRVLPPVEVVDAAVASEVEYWSDDGFSVLPSELRAIVGLTMDPIGRVGDCTRAESAPAATIQWVELNCDWSDQVLGFAAFADAGGRSAVTIEAVTNDVSVSELSRLVWQGTHDGYVLPSVTETPPELKATSHLSSTTDASASDGSVDVAVAEAVGSRELPLLLQVTMIVGGIVIGILVLVGWIRSAFSLRSSRRVA